MMEHVMIKFLILALAGLLITLLGVVISLIIPSFLNLGILGMFIGTIGMFGAGCSLLYGILFNKL